MRKNIVKLLSTFFYLGYIPPAPGSTASLVGALLWYAFSENISVYVLLCAAFIAIGFYVSDRMEKEVGEKDPSCVVIDEVAGSMITFCMLPLSLPIIITAFFVFRAFDMFKIYPANEFEKIKGGSGIMLDDIVAGLYANIFMHAALALSKIL